MVSALFFGLLFSKFIGGFVYNMCMFFISLCCNCSCHFWKCNQIEEWHKMQQKLLQVQVCAKSRDYSKIYLHRSLDCLSNIWLFEIRPKNWPTAIKKFWFIDSGRLTAKPVFILSLTPIMYLSPTATKLSMTEPFLPFSMFTFAGSKTSFYPLKPLLC